MTVVVLLEQKPASRRRARDPGWESRAAGAPLHGIPVHEAVQLDNRPLTGALATTVVGKPADGSPPAGRQPKSVVWVDGGDEVVAHLDSLTTRVLDGAVVASLDLESDQTGRAPVVVRFAVAGAGAEAGLVAATDEVAGGNPVLAARWGRAVQEAVWSGLLSLAQQHADVNGEAPHGISAVAGALRLHLGKPLVFVARRRR